MQMWQLPPLRPEEILLYSRKSQTDDPALTIEETLAKHEQMLDEYVERNLPEVGRIPEENRYREVVSGETIDKRPKFLEVLRRIESPHVKAVLCVEPQRLSRGSLKDIGRIVELFRYSNTIVITRQYAYDLRDDRDRESFERELMRGNEYLEYYKRIQQNGRLQSVKNGNYIGQTAPYGYKKVQYKEGKLKCFTLEPIPEEAEVVKMVFEMYRDGIGMVRIADKLNDMHIPAPKSKKWSREGLSVMLANVHYIGKVKWNWRKTVKTIEDGEVVASRPRAEEYLVYDGKQPAIIDQELWDAVQEIRGKIPRNPKNKDGFNPLAGLMFCECGRAISARPYKSKGVEYCDPRFLCSQQRECGNASCKMSEIINEVIKVLEATIEDFEIRIEKGTDDSAQIHHQMVERLEKRLRELQELEIAQWDAKTKGGMPEHVFQKLNGDTVKEIAEIQQALCTARGSIPEPINLQERVTTFKSALEALKNPNAPVKEKNKLLKACIERITYSRKRVGNNGHPKRGEETPIRLDFKLRV
jgi:DNA invertase Pin-like site-specific DNA recombinase